MYGLLLDSYKQPRLKLRHSLVSQRHVAQSQTLLPEPRWFSRVSVMGRLGTGSEAPVAVSLHTVSSVREEGQALNTVTHLNNQNDSSC